MLRVILDFGNAGKSTGTGVYSRGLLEGLEMHCREDVEAAEAGISSVSTTLRPVRRLIYLSRLRRLRAGGYGGADVVHFTNVYVPQRRIGTAYAVTIHDLDAIDHPEVYTRRYALYYERTVQASIDRAHVVLTDTEAVRSMMLARYPGASGKVRVVGVGLSREFTAAADRAGTHSAPGDPMVLFVGRLEMKKNLEWLVHTVGEGVRKGAIPPVRLVLAGGRGYGFARIEEAMKRHAANVSWVEAPSVDVLAGLYRSARVVVLPSRCEGFGIPLLEAMHCGTALVASRIPTSLEVAGGCAHFFNLDDADGFYHAVNDALHGREQEERHAAASRTLEAYSWPGLARAATAAYREARALA